MAIRPGSLSLKALAHLYAQRAEIAYREFVETIGKPVPFGISASRSMEAS